MLNYPFFSLFRSYFASKFANKAKIEDETILTMRCGISDIDPYMEINNGRYQTLADIGRFNHGFRTGFFSIAKKNKIYFTVAGASIKYRHRIPFGEKFTMTTKIIYVDEKWTYYLHKFIVKGRVTSTLLARTGVVKDGKLIKSKDASLIFNLNIPDLNLPKWVNDWIKSDEHNPFFLTGFSPNHN